MRTDDASPAGSNRDHGVRLATARRRPRRRRAAAAWWTSWSSSRWSVGGRPSDSVDVDVLDSIVRRGCRERRSRSSPPHPAKIPRRHVEGPENYDAAYVRRCPDTRGAAAPSAAARAAAPPAHPARSSCLPSPRAAPHRGSPLTAAFASPPRSNLIFRFLQNKTRIQIWLFENTELRIEGKIIGFDEYMNLVLDDAEELSLKQKTRKPLGAPRRPRTLRY